VNGVFLYDFFCFNQIGPKVKKLEVKLKTATFNQNTIRLCEMFYACLPLRNDLAGNGKNNPAPPRLPEVYFYSAIISNVSNYSASKPKR
jgi:hypothetical protein